jgi:hypothetical protein
MAVGWSPTATEAGREAPAAVAAQDVHHARRALVAHGEVERAVAVEVPDRQSVRHRARRAHRDDRLQHEVPRRGGRAEEDRRAPRRRERRVQGEIDAAVPVEVGGHDRLGTGADGHVRVAREAARPVVPKERDGAVDQVRDRKIQVAVAVEVGRHRGARAGADGDARRRVERRRTRDEHDHGVGCLAGHRQVEPSVGVVHGRDAPRKPRTG